MILLIDWFWRWDGHANGWLLAHRLDVAPLVVACLALLALTHGALAAIMWFQRPWLPSERALFQFMVAKTVFWTVILQDNAAHYGAPIHAKGGVILVLVLVTATQLDLRLFRRYFLGDEGVTPPAEAAIVAAAAVAEAAKVAATTVAAAVAEAAVVAAEATAERERQAVAREVEREARSVVREDRAVQREDRAINREDREQP